MVERQFRRGDDIITMYEVDGIFIEDSQYIDKQYIVYNDFIKAVVIEINGEYIYTDFNGLTDDRKNQVMKIVSKIRDEKIDDILKLNR